MSGNSHYNYITIRELIFIHVYVTGEEIPSSQALQILKQFVLEKILGTIRQVRRYRIRKNGEELKHRAMNYCSSHFAIHF
ncbi:TPA: 50S ribosomal protein L7ae [Bacillus cereus]|nr:50S ribosomal protein L7ae [Bacillus cereus]HDR3914637.1 50S ribosomal protein L7ae [Bacillus cereus]HDV7172719.1 50S ribosomal protein L7ae [Bacillus cereus]